MVHVVLVRVRYTIRGESLFLCTQMKNLRLVSLCRFIWWSDKRFGVSQFVVLHPLTISNHHGSCGSRSILLSHPRKIFLPMCTVEESLVGMCVLLYLMDCYMIWYLTCLFGHFSFSCFTWFQSEFAVPAKQNYYSYVYGWRIYCWYVCVPLLGGALHVWVSHILSFFTLLPCPLTTVHVVLVRFRYPIHGKSFFLCA